MNSIDFFEAFSNIDDSFVFEVEKYKKRKKQKKYIMLIVKSVACIVLFMSLGLFWQSYPQNPNWKYEDVVRKENCTDDEDEFNSVKQYNEMSTNEIMENLNLFFSDNEMPNWFGDYYLENDMVYVLLVKNNKTNQERVKKWAKSEEIIFIKADFTSSYLNEVIQKMYEDMNNGEIDFVSKITLENKKNRITIETNRQISDKEKQSLYLYDKLGEGGALIIYCN